jgi:hypothetical protein
MTINPQEFDRYEVDPGTEESVDVTFSLRECKVCNGLVRVVILSLKLSSWTGDSRVL